MFKKTVSLVILAILSVGLYIGVAYAQKWTFDGQDVKGEWSFSSYSVNPRDNWSGWTYGKILFNEAGFILGGIGESWDGYQSRVTNGRYSIDKNGFIRGNFRLIQRDGRSHLISFKGNMNMGKDTIVLTLIDQTVTISIMAILIKRPERTFSTQ